MAKVRGKEDVRRYFSSLPENIRRKLLVGAGRAGAKVIAEEARTRSISHEVTEAISTNVRTRGNKIIARVQVKGPGAYLAPWLEYGTDPHFISVSDEQREGRSVRRINRLVKEGSLVIGGRFVGSTVHHPGARPHPFLRVALDVKQGEAIGAMQAYVNARVRPGGIVGEAEPEGDA